MGQIVRIILCFSITAFSACKISLPQEKQLEYLKSQPHLKSGIKQSLRQKKLFTEGSWPKRQWWLTYQSAELNDLITTSLANNPTIHEIQSRIAVAREEAIVTGSNLFPLIFFDSSLRNQYLSKNGLYRALDPKLPLNAKLINLALSFNYEFDFWGKYHNLLDEAIGKARAEEAEAAEVELIISTALSQAYFAYKTNLQRKQLYKELLVLRQKINNLQKLMLKKGLSSRLPVLFSDENNFEAEKWLATINEELSNNKHLINVLAGRGPDTPLPTKSILPTLPKKLEIPKTLSIDLLARRPDLMAQIWRAKAAAFKTGAELSEYYPNVNIISFIGLESVAWKKLLNSTSGTVYSKPALHLPIFTAGAIQASINAAKAEFDAAIFAYNNLLLRSTQEVLDVFAFAEKIYQQKQEQNRIVSQAQKRYDLACLRAQKGLDSLFDTYYLKEALIQKKLVNISLNYNQYLASIKLTKALGGGYYEVEIPLKRKI